MSDKKTRRAFLTTVGAASMTLAGCLNSGSDQGRVTTNVTSQSQSQTSAKTTTETGTQTTDNATTTADPEFSRGEVVEDFESLDDWGTILGKASADTESVYRGSQSVLVQNEGDSAGIYRSFPDGLNLSKNDLSVALQLEKPSSGKLAVDLYAPGEENHAVARRYIPEQLDGWVRFDIGYTNEPGTPKMSDVRELRFVVHPTKKNGDVKFRLDDLRMMPKTDDNGQVILSFDDSFASHYDVAFKELKKRGWSGVAATIPSEVGGENSLSIGQLRKMNDQGWDISSHPQISSPVTPLPSMSKSKQRKTMKENQRWLELKGFTEGSKYFITPFDRMGDDTYELVSEMYDLGFIFGACNNATKPSDPHFVSRVYGSNDGLHGAWRQLKLAKRRNQLTVLAFHHIGKDGETSVKNFKWLLDIIEKHDIEVVTASDLAKKYE